MLRRAAVLSLTSIATLACAMPAAAEAPSAAAVADDEKARLAIGKLRGMKQADEDHPVRVVVRAEGDDFVSVRVVLRNADDEIVGTSKRFELAGGQRKDVRIRVDGPLPLGRYVARAKGRTGPVGS
jgi:hypothetical protein